MMEKLNSISIKTILLGLICIFAIIGLIFNNEGEKSEVFALPRLGLIEIYNQDRLIKRENVDVKQFISGLNLTDAALTDNVNNDNSTYTIKLYDKEKKETFNINNNEIIKLDVYSDSEQVKLNGLVYKTNNNMIDNIKDKYDLMELKEPTYNPVLGNLKAVEIAAREIGNVGGEPYWRWYGLDHRIEWCCVFVSWVGYQSGYLQAGEFPKFPNVSAGVSWYRARNKWQGKSYIPSPGDVIFFDLLLENRPHHVGMVEKVENGRIYTIEGNYSDSVRRRSYPIGSPYIYGYGTPDYRVKTPIYLK